MEFILDAGPVKITEKRGEEHHPHLCTDSIMKTLCFSLGLLLLAVCCCDAIPKGVKFSTAPQICCFSFKMSVTPLKFVSSVTQTHTSCPKKAFIVHTVRGRQICYSQTFKWAQDLYRLHNTDGRS